MSEEQLTISSVTGVDVEFQIAGPGSRSYAFVVDWHIRFLFAFAWFVASIMIVNGALSLGIPTGKEATMAFFVFLPMLVLYFFYHPIIEIATRGRTPGKRIAGVRVVTREGDVPTVGALLIRNLFRLIDSLPAFYIIGLIMTMVTKQHVRVGDIAAGTLLVIDHDREGKSLEQFDQLSRRSHLDPQLAELIDELLQRWKTLAVASRCELAVTLLAKLDKQSDPRHLRSLHESELKERLRHALEQQRT